MEINFAYRDEILNISSMTNGCLPLNYSHQIILCNKSKLKDDRKGPFILVPKKTNSKYKLSPKGSVYSYIHSDKITKYRFFGIITDQIEINPSRKLFETLYAKDLFPLWTPDSPVSYFQKNKGYLLVFRVYKFSNKFKVNLLENVKGQFYYFRLTKPFFAKNYQPVVNDSTYNKMVHKIKSICNKTNHKGVDKRELDTIPSEVITKTDKIVSQEYENFTLQQLEEMINKKTRVPYGSYFIFTEVRTRDPLLKLYAKKRANGRCECCNRKAPFKKKSNEQFLEIHHIKALSVGGNDSIDNVVAVCPNCHRELHYGKNKKQLRKELCIKMNHNI